MDTFQTLSGVTVVLKLGTRRLFVSADGAVKHQFRPHDGDSNLKPDLQIHTDLDNIKVFEVSRKREANVKWDLPGGLRRHFWHQKVPIFSSKNAGIFPQWPYNS